MPLGDWISQRTLSLLHAIAGADPVWPWDLPPEPTEAEAAATEAAAKAAEQYQLEHSAMR